jgi:hypothetical protein
VKGIVPRYGNYGGPDYTSGHLNIGEDADHNPTFQWKEDKTPVDGMDKLFSNHDYQYALAEYYAAHGDWWKAIEIQYAADKALVEGLKNYDPHNDPYCLSDGVTDWGDAAHRESAASYRWKAKGLFEGIVKTTGSVNLTV